MGTYEFGFLMGVLVAAENEMVQGGHPATPTHTPTHTNEPGLVHMMSETGSRIVYFRSWAPSLGSMEMSNGKIILIEHYIPRYIDAVRCYV